MTRTPPDGVTDEDDSAARPGDPSREPLRPEAAVRDHLANERTLLAWQRTALGAVGIGFLVDRFALETPGAAPTTFGSLLGLALIALGGILSVVGTYRFVRTEREIDTQTYEPSILAHVALTAAIVIAAVGLAIFLVVESA
jgi:putative membrane protein